VILEAFAKYLHGADQSVEASAILARWLWERLTRPPEDQTDKILRLEIEIELAPQRRGRAGLRLEGRPNTPVYVFNATSESGKRLLKSLYEYALSYEQQKWARWVHCVKASDFNQLYNDDKNI
jgi:hypothetical protein